MLLTMCLLLSAVVVYTAPASSFWVMTIDAATIAGGYHGRAAWTQPRALKDAAWRRV